MYDVALGIYPTLNMLCLVYDLWHRYTVIIPTFGMLHLIYDLCHRHLVFTPAHNNWHRYCHAVFDTDIFHAIFDTDACHTIFDVWYPTPILVLLHLSLDIGHRYLICRTWLLLLTHGICYTFMWYKYLDLTLPPLIPDYMTYSWLSLLRGHDMIIILLLPDIWYFWAPVLLYTWTPEIGRLLTLLLYYTTVDPVIG